MFDYLTLKIIWWCFVGILLIGFALMDGFDFGVGMLLPFVGKTDVERRIMLNSVGPTWEGNQTWFITAGGALFAAWPLAYAAAFSGFYIALMVLLFALFFRPVGFDYRSKLADPRWRSTWDWLLFIGGFVPPLIFGIAFGSLLQGVPFHYNSEMRLAYEGGFFDLLNPFGILSGILSVAMLCMHGAAFLLCKTDAAIVARARIALKLSAAITVVCFIIGGWMIATQVQGYHITSMPDANTAFMPIAKTVERINGAWLSNFQQHSALYLIPGTAIVAALLSMLFTHLLRPRLAFIATGTSVAGIILTAGVAMFPFVMPSSLQPNSSLTAWDVVASHKSLGIMFWVVVFFLPIIMMYTAWIYRVMRGKVDAQHIEDHQHSAY
ncbi:cytochrome d ubiquinol oxidase subunit II [Undibacterium sp. LX40W]|uniref:Cytochrome d ubiquinol oxidase subunit II n=1 Tax=Undibacterium nitidum TaxID=2762298 RepID=A0A923HQP2_9BURK|nr:MULTISPECIES: cytochrome d ubiquinol oxidase subunit II [Undibacterium]MBC3882188.1 cytochrome d ubiquinol oxidase subunit II [Undibacterium nitidum]MBC3892469.1 cytochrome d ubiquinol oxidase subunit II [Undibacterium sp. LX40W]